MKQKQLKEKGTHSFEIEDVVKYGSIEKALIMKEIKSIAIYKLRNEKNSWVYYSRRALEKKFPYMKKSSIDRWLKELKKDGWLKTRIKNKFKYDKTQSFLPTELEGVSQKLKNVSQNGTPLSQNGTTIPSHSSSLLNNNNKGSNQVATLRNYFIKKCKELKGFEPEMAFGKEGKLLKDKLKRYSVEQLKDLIDNFMESKIGEDLGFTLSICLSAPVINQWLIGKLTKPKKPTYNGNPMKKRFGKWYVLEQGEWKEFADSESKIVYI